jgi:serine/threonine protein kinase
MNGEHFSSVWLPVGTALAGRYVLTAQLATGGVSHVYRAIDTVRARPYAIKTLSAHVPPSQELGVPRMTRSDVAQRVRHEALITNHLRHPNVPRIYDYGDADLADGSALGFMVMELLHGEPLANRLERETLLPWPDAVRIGASVADVLAVAHRRGVTHRDLNPDNVMLTPIGVKIIDYGHAEQTVAERDRADDVYSLGTLLYRMLTGTSPYQTRSVGRPRRGIAPRCLAPIPVLAIPGLPTALTDLVRACMDLSSSLRPTAKSAAIDLWRLITL